MRLGLTNGTFSHLATGLEELIFDRVVIRLNESLRIQTAPFGQLTMIDTTVEMLVPLAVVSADSNRMERVQFDVLPTDRFQLQADNTVSIIDSTFESVQSNGLAINATKIIFSGNQLHRTDRQAFKRVGLYGNRSEISLHLIDNTWSNLALVSPLDVDCDSLRRYHFNDDALRSIIRVDGNAVPCTCSFPDPMHVADQSNPFNDPIRNFFYEAFGNNTKCISSSDYLIDFYKRRCGPPPQGAPPSSPAVPSLAIASLNVFSIFSVVFSLMSCQLIHSLPTGF